ncbi:MAG TPA: GNAT family N-acetyltransferase [Tepidisphaeraceae bacterium]|jgi:ribosomal protein S18 acetylase RimI-like enzyme|nr:GNAT family N-acetyltransferase [Tepidisphaeraceae bacterium]
MLSPIPADQHEQHLRALTQTAHQILPILNFSPEAITQFLQQHAPLPGQDLYHLHLPTGQSAFLKSRQPNTLQFEYLLPSNWHARYDILRGAIQLLQQHADATHRDILFWLDDHAPSHNAYFAGLLPTLGFTLTPRIELLAPATALAHLHLPELPPGIIERPFDLNDLPALNSFYNHAFSIHPSHHPDPNPLGHVPNRPDTLHSFHALYHQTRPIALVFGMLPISRYPSLYNNRLNIEELAVHPDYTNRHLGRYLTLRCMQSLQHLHPTPPREFFIGTNRTYATALHLYHSLGFRPASYYTYATYTPNRPF